MRRDERAVALERLIEAARLTGREERHHSPLTEPVRRAMTERRSDGAPPPAAPPFSPRMRENGQRLVGSR